MNKGVLPYSGGYMEQPNKILDFFSIIANYDYLDAKQKTSKGVE